MYGLKQAHFAWPKRLCADFLASGFVEHLSAPCVFLKVDGSKYSFTFVYEHDLLIIEMTKEGAALIILWLKKPFKLERSASVEVFLGSASQLKFV